MDFYERRKASLEDEMDQLFFESSCCRIYDKWKIEKRKIFPSTDLIKEYEEEMQRIYFTYSSKVFEEEKNMVLNPFTEARIISWSDKKVKVFHSQKGTKKRKREFTFEDDRTTGDGETRNNYSRGNYNVPYMRLTHFRNTLRHLEGRENRKLPVEILELLKSLKKREDFLNTKELRKEFRSFLKSQKLHKWYKDTTALLMKSFGRKVFIYAGGEMPLVVYPFLLPKITKKFNEFTAVYDIENQKKKWRKKYFINYSVVAYHLLKTNIPEIEVKRTMFDFPVSEERIEFNEKIVKHIFDILKWKYYSR